MLESKKMQTTMALVSVTPKQRSNLVEFFGEKGADIVLAHMDNLEGTFDSASTIILRIIQGKEESSK
jgi:hypothetical protein